MTCLNTFENSKYLFYFDQKSISFDFYKKIGNLSPLYLPDKLKDDINLNEFLIALNVNIIDSTNLDVVYENTDEKSFNWLEKLFFYILPHFAKIIIKKKEIQKKYQNIEEIITLGKRIQFIKVSKLTLKYKGESFLEPLTYRKNLNERIAIFCKVKNVKNKSLGNISCASFICREITNILQISNDFALELFSLLLLDKEEINEYMFQKGIY